MSKSRDWEMTKEDRARQMNLLDELIPDNAFQDAEITENLTGKASVPKTYMPPKGRSSID
jgi:hypothetical protein